MNEIVKADEIKSSFSKEVGVETKFQCLKYKNMTHRYICVCVYSFVKKKKLAFKFLQLMA